MFPFRFSIKSGNVADWGRQITFFVNPNQIHLEYDEDNDLEFNEYISIISASLIFKPKKGDSEPNVSEFEWYEMLEKIEIYRGGSLEEQQFGGIANFAFNFIHPQHVLHTPNSHLLPINFESNQRWKLEKNATSEFYFSVILSQEKFFEIDNLVLEITVAKFQYPTFTKIISEKSQVVNMFAENKSLLMRVPQCAANEKITMMYFVPFCFGERNKPYKNKLTCNFKMKTIWGIKNYPMKNSKEDWQELVSFKRAADLLHKYNGFFVKFDHNILADLQENTKTTLEIDAENFNGDHLSIQLIYVVQYYTV